MEKQLRLTTGLIMATFVVLHLINHGLGLISLDAMEGFRKPFIAFWHHPLATGLLYGSVGVHFVLALLSLYRRTTLRMPMWEGFQLLLGLSIPPLIFTHVIGTRVTSELLGVTTDFKMVLEALWNLPGAAYKQTFLLLVVWGHFLIGLHYWLRLYDGYRRWLPLWQMLASLLPVLALLGFYRMGLSTETVDMGARFAALDQRHPAERALIRGMEDRMLLGYLAALGLVILARYLRAVYRVNFGSVIIEHPSRGTLAAPVGQTLLEALRDARVPHSSVCGGRARCTTCRVRVVRGAEDLEPPGPDEVRALEGVNAERDVRLACQLHLTHDIAIVPLIPPESGIHYVRKPGGVEGKEQLVAALVVDLRGSTALGERRLPYDVVFILNQFFAEMAAALNESGGHYAQFNGDGLMALYGLEVDFETGCRQALHGAQAMFRRLEDLNRRLARELDEPLKIGIGIHSGEAIVGTMGPPAAPILSAIGDTINGAARLEAKTKKLGGPLVISRDTAERSGIPLTGLTPRKVELRGRVKPLDVVVIEEPLRLSIPE
ncbi:adenylate/guanylate cyclase domain-containing protein [Motiliproteus sp. SC1-56]|uniref:adenylate/guanylate cyclase domain-containing protein n=1 Tax=Motiliproteus sp. SC1-56 TaxID=2799565 RepID=UPI001A8CA768|nr:adenylate/guanylate cyclase domain-containing protein [Motiliproteus sp. SC1-56]